MKAKIAARLKFSHIHVCPCGPTLFRHLDDQDTKGSPAPVYEDGGTPTAVGGNVDPARCVEKVYVGGSAELRGLDQLRVSAT